MADELGAAVAATGPTTLLASLPMFDLDELRSHHDTLWSAVAAELRLRGVAAPDTLSRPGVPLSRHWRHPDLLFSQTCGFPYAAYYRPQLALIGTFHYDLPVDDGPGFYRSLLVARTTDRRVAAAPSTTDLRAYSGATVAINNTDSLSGCVSLGVTLLDCGVEQVGDVIVTGAHVDSLGEMQAGRVDLAIIDALTFALLADVRPGAVSGVTVIGSGPRIPCTPLVTGHVHLVELIRDALRSALNRVDPSVLTTLRIRSFVPHPDEVYVPTIAMGERAAELMPVAEESAVPGNAQIYCRSDSGIQSP